jgi:hypothetical protein
MNSSLHSEIARYRAADFHREAALARHVPRRRRDVPSSAMVARAFAAVRRLGAGAQRRPQPTGC